jgi:hypothetical protein
VRGTTNAVPDAGRLVDVLQKKAAQRVDDAIDAHSITVGAAWIRSHDGAAAWLSLIQRARLTRRCATAMLSSSRLGGCYQVLFSE